MAVGPGDTDTPALVVDADVLEDNIAHMAEAAERTGSALRPHAKTHKTIEIARLQLAAGAVGLSVATLGEAEVFADSGVDDLFVAYPLWVGDPARSRRLAALAERVRLRVGCDSAEAAGALGRAVAREVVEVLVEIDSGHRRSGVDPRLAPRVAGACSAAGLRVVGVFTFPGHGYGPGMPPQAARDEADALEQATEALEAAGHTVGVRSGGSTPTAKHTVGGVVTELRPGVYVFNDAQQIALGSCGAGQVALSARARVVSAPSPGRVVLDAGSKVLGADRPPWVPGHGLVRELDHAPVTVLSEHHAVAQVPPGQAAPDVGDLAHVLPNHVCTAVNLVDELVVTRQGTETDRWKVAARGRNS